MLFFALLAILAAIILVLISSRQRESAALPRGKVIYADTRKWGDVEEALYDPTLKLTGKPDYLVEHGREIIPVEVKSSQVKNTPYEGHILQLAAYCALAEKEYQQRPSYGILHYPQKTFRIKYTQELEGRFLEVLASMRRHELQTNVNREHNAPVRCAKCGYRSKCNQALAQDRVE
ncbi:MAG: CRISPR-associated exonuclease Cas4 [Chloroflexi bacterium]|nr:CRISPR-associated exonuclease Cas4 [Chloroflexota bacterium]